MLDAIREDSDLNPNEYQQLTDERGSSPESLSTGNGDHVLYLASGAL